VHRAVKIIGSSLNYNRTVFTAEQINTGVEKTFKKVET